MEDESSTKRIGGEKAPDGRRDENGESEKVKSEPVSPAPRSQQKTKPPQTPPSQVIDSPTPTPPQAHEKATSPQVTTPQPKTKETTPGARSEKTPKAREKTPPSTNPATPEDWESRAPLDWQSPAVDAKTIEVPKVAEVPVPRELITQEEKKTPTLSPPPFGAAWAASPVPTLHTREDGNSKLNGHTATTTPVATGPTTSTTPVPSTRSTSGVSSSLSEYDKNLLTQYDAMQSKFELEVKGFDLSEVHKTKHYFHFEEPPGVGVWPLPYTQIGLPKECARLVVLSLLDAPAVAAAGAACAREIMKIFGECKIGCFNVARNAYHVSVFFLSLPSAPISDPFTLYSSGTTSSGKTMDVSLATVSLKTIGDSFRCDVERETKTVEVCIGDKSKQSSVGKQSDVSTSITLEVDRITMTTSGALLLLFRDPNGELQAMRDKLKSSFPGAPQKQTQIAHCTLLRAFPKSETQLTDTSSGRALADCKAACARWTSRVRGTTVKVDRAWLVREERFSSIDGARQAFRIGG